MNLYSCCICYKEIYAPQARNFQLPLSDDTSFITAPLADRISILKKKQAYRDAAYIRCKSAYDAMLFKTVYLAERGLWHFLYCASCGPLLEGAVEYTSLVHRTMNGDAVRPFERHPNDTVSVGSGDSNVRQSSFETEAKESPSLQISGVEVGNIRVNLSRTMLNISKAKLNDDVFDFDEQRYFESTHGKLPLRFMSFMELSQTLKILFQISSKNRITYLQAITELQGHTKSNKDVKKEIVIEARSNYRDLRNKLYLGVVRRLKKDAYTLTAVDNNINERELERLFRVADNARVYAEELSKFQLLPQYPEDNLTPKTLFLYLQQGKGVDQVLLDRLCEGSKYSQQFCALWLVCPELRKMMYFAQRNFGDKFSGVIRLLATSKNYFNNKLSYADLYEIIYESMRNDMLMLRAYAAKCDLIAEEWFDTLLAIENLSIAQFIKAITENTHFYDDIHKACMPFYSTLNSQTQVPIRKDLDAHELWATLHQQNYDDTMRVRAKTQNLSPLLVGLCELSELLKTVSTVAFEKGVPFSRHFYSVYAQQERPQEFLAAIHDDAKFTIMQLDEMAKENRTVLVHHSIILDHVRYITPDAIHFLLLGSKSSRMLNCYYYRPPGTVTVRYVVGFLVIMSAIVLIAFLVVGFRHKTPGSRALPASPRPPFPNSATTPGQQPDHGHTTLRPITIPNPTSSVFQPGILTTPQASYSSSSSAMSSSTPEVTATAITPKVTTRRQASSTSTTTYGFLYTDSSTKTSTMGTEKALDQCAKLPDNNETSCSSTVINSVISVLQWALSAGMQTMVDFGNKCPNAKSFINLLYTWYSTDPQFRDQLDMVWQMSIEQFIQLLNEHANCA